METRTGVEVITPERAEEILLGNTHNRNASRIQVSRLARAIEAGDWTLNGETIKIASDGTVIDGQHRLMAVIEAGRAITTFIVYGLDMSVQETIDNNAPRNLGHILQLRGEAQTAALAAVVRKMALYERIGLARTFDQSRSWNVVTNSECLRYLDANPIVREYVKLSRPLNRVGIPGAAGALLWYVFDEIDTDDAQFFFERLISGTELSVGDPIYALRRFLSNMLAGSRGKRNERYIAAVVIKAWNEFRRGNKNVGLLSFRGGGAKAEDFPEPI